MIFIYRDALYNDEADPAETELIIAKHRNGPTGKTPLVFLGQYPKFGNAPRPQDAVYERTGDGPPLVDLADEA